MNVATVHEMNRIVPQKMYLICVLLVLFFLNFLVELSNKLRGVKNQENCKFLVDPSHKQDEYMSKAYSVSLNKASTMVEPTQGEDQSLCITAMLWRSLSSIYSKNR